MEGTRESGGAREDSVCIASVSSVSSGQALSSMPPGIVKRGGAGHQGFRTDTQAQDASRLRNEVQKIYTEGRVYSQSKAYRLFSRAPGLALLGQGQGKFQGDSHRATQEAGQTLCTVVKEGCGRQAGSVPVQATAANTQA